MIRRLLVALFLLLCCSVPCWATSTDDVLTTGAPLPTHIIPRKPEPQEWQPDLSGVPFINEALPSPANAIVSDSFTGTEGTLATAHYPTPIGDGYTIHPQSASQVSPVLDNANRLMSADGSPVTLITKETMPSSDYEVSADITLVANIGNLTQGLGLRYDPVAQTGYVAYWHFNGFIYLDKVVAGTPTQLQAISTPVALTTHNIKLSAVGTTITLSIDSVPQTPVVDSSVTGAGRAALILREVATNTTGAHTDNFLVSNTGSAALQIVSQTPPAQGTVSTAYSRTLASAGGTGSHTWSLSSGTLPTGLSLGSDGTLSGTPSVAGLYVFTLAVTDSIPNVANRTFRMGVNGTGAWFVPAGAALQPFLTAAARGDSVDVDNTGTYSGSFSLASKSGSCTSSSSTWIHVRSSALTALTAQTAASNGRALPAYASNMPTIRSVDNIGGTPALTAASNACGWKLSGLQITNDTSVVVNEMIALSGANFMTFDKVLVYPKEALTVRTPPYNSTGRIAFASAGANFSIINSSIHGWYGLPPGAGAGATAHDSTGLTYEGPGPMLYQNNRTEAWFNGIQMGGSDQAATNPAATQASPPPTVTSATLSHTTGLSVGMPIAVELPCDGNLTTLSGGIGPSDTTVPVVSTTLFDATGRIAIATESMIYTGKTSNTFTGVTRGVNGSGAISHSNGAGVKAPYCKRTCPGFQCWGDGVVATKSGNDITFSSLTGIDNNGGGSKSTVPAVVVPTSSGQVGWTGPRISNVSILGGLFEHPTEFSAWQLANNNNNPKAFVEIKQVDGLIYRGNRHTGWPSTLGFNGHNQSGGNTWSTLSNILVEYNLFDETTGLFLPLADGYAMTTNGVNIIVRHNLFMGKDKAVTLRGISPQFIFSGKAGDTTDIHISHNTSTDGYLPLGADFGSTKAFDWSYGGPQSNQVPTGLSMKDNVFGFGEFGLTCEVPPGTLAACWPSFDEDQNLIVKNVAVTNPTNAITVQFPNSLVSTSWAAVLFVGTCDKDNPVTNCALQAGSPGNNAASDGTDTGVNITTLLSNCPDCAPAAPVTQTCNWHTSPTCQ